MTPANETLNICGPIVKRLRLTRDPIITQEQLAVGLQILGWDIDRFGISKIERGQRQVTDKELVLLARALAVPVSELLDTTL
jgi:transcriptional regulator with XRE-family HTH domain